MASMPSDMHPLRLFFALWPSPAEQAALARWQPQLRAACGGRAMRADTLHLTLAFLGQVQRSRLTTLQQAVRGLTVPPFRLCFDTAQHWPHNHIVYANPSAPPAILAMLVVELAACLRQAAFDFDDRAFHPHVTLLRNAHCTGAPPAQPAPVCWDVRNFALVQSMTDAQGARYEVLARFGVASLE